MYHPTSANTDPITVKPAAANGYNLFGDASGQVTLGPGDVLAVKYNDTLPDVAAGAKDITITSADAVAKYKIILGAG